MSKVKLILEVGIMAAGLVVSIIELFKPIKLKEEDVDAISTQVKDKLLNTAVASMDNA